MMVILSSTLVKVLVTSYRVGFYAELYGFMLDNSRRETLKDTKPRNYRGNYTEPATTQLFAHRR